MRGQRINSGQMRSKIEKWGFEGGRLVRQSTLFARAERKNKRCIYSERGVASRETLQISFYKNAAISPQNLIKHDGQWWAVAFSGDDEGRIYSFAECGRCKVYEISLIRKEKVLNDKNIAATVECEKVLFDGILCEKFIRAEAGEHFLGDMREYVLIYPKETDLKLSDVLLCGGKKYAVREVHDGEFLNEATVIYKGEV